MSNPSESLIITSVLRTIAGGWCNLFHTLFSFSSIWCRFSEAIRVLNVAKDKSDNLKEISPKFGVDLILTFIVLSLKVVVSDACSCCS